jgi:photosystem II stability/assembly factor-like uncharacterized protein
MLMSKRAFGTGAILLLLASPAFGQRPPPEPPATAASRQAAWERHLALDESTLLKGLRWRSVGPVVQGGRLVDIESVPGDPYTFYVAYASGGVWKTTNNGVTFEPLFDDQSSIIVSDIAMDPSNPQIVYVGTGENNSSRSSYGGTGVFRSEDGGASWQHVGLDDSDRIGRLLVDPRDSRKVFAAALGRLYTPGGQRGVYRSLDRGANWELVLPGDSLTGFVDLAFDPQNPEVLYAASWERVRRPWDFVEGGVGSGVWKSTDGGSTWRRLESGFPRGEEVGRVGLAVSPSNPQIVYASLDNQALLPEEDWDLGDGAVTAKRLRGMSKDDFLRQDPEEIEDFLRRYDLDPRLDARRLLEAVRSDSLTVQDLLSALENANRQLFETDVRGIEVWRSDDGGESWHRMNDEPIREAVYTYGYYFGQIRVAPDDPDRVYILGVPLLVSDDRGATFRQIAGRRVHGDHQAFWIDPNYPERVIAGNDGGLAMSFDGGGTWLILNSTPVGQFYTVTVDMAEPYNIYGGLQDNGVLKGSSKSRPGITEAWQRVGGGDGMYVQVDPRDNKTVYWGFQFGNYFRQGVDGRESVRPGYGIKDEPLRYNWSSPILLSTHNADVLYFGSNRLFRSMDRGETWTAISPDLTRSPNRGDVPFATITSLSESPRAFGLLWVGTDDGHVHVSRGGFDWREVATGLPADRWVSRVEASHHVDERAYVSLNGYRNDDITAYLFRTDDLGDSWRDIAVGLPDEAINVVREDPVNPAVVYVGTDRGAYVSTDTGATWQAAGAGLPSVPVHDLIVHPRDRELVAGTHGRSVWVLDVLPVQELTAQVRSAAVHVFPLEPVRFDRRWRSRRSRWFYRAEDAPYRDLPIWVREAGPVQWAVLDSAGRALRRGELDATPGVNTLRWDLLLDPDLALAAERERLRDEEEIDPADTPWSESVRLGRPLYVTPGSYRVQLQVGSDSAEAEIAIEPPKAREPRAPTKPRIRGERKKKTPSDLSRRPATPAGSGSVAQIFDLAEGGERGLGPGPRDRERSCRCRESGGVTEWLSAGESEGECTVERIPRPGSVDHGNLLARHVLAAIGVGTECT